jgi:4-hydroxybenzoyl-CoA thioesterase
VTSFIFRRQLTVEWGHCDPAGIVFNARFFEMFDNNNWLLFEAALGVKQPLIAATYKIWSFPLVDARANFLKPAKFGDVIEIASRIIEFRRSSFDIEHKISLGGELAVDGQETRVWTGYDKDDPAKLRAIPIPADVTAKFG